VVKAVFFDLFGTLGEFEGKVSDVKICNLLQSHGYEICPRPFATPSASSLLSTTLGMASPVTAICSRRPSNGLA
jgi:hypothetical protein